MIAQSSKLSYIIPAFSGQRPRLNLSHAGTGTATAAASAATQVDGSRAGHEDRDNHGGHVASPAEPEESSGGLGLAAALGHVV